MRGAAALAALALLMTSAHAEAQDCGELPRMWEGVAFAVDGSTLAGLGLKAPVRLWGVQAPQLRDKDQFETMTGMQARAALEDLLAAGERRVACRAAKWDRSCHIVAQCTINAEIPRGAKPQPHDIALRLLEDGLAYGTGLNEALPWDHNASARYAHFETLARQARKGLWPAWLGLPEETK